LIIICILVLGLIAIILYYSIKLRKANNCIKKKQFIIDNQSKELSRFHLSWSVNPHVYKKNKTSGIGFCDVCFSDDENDGNHIK